MLENALYIIASPIGNLSDLTKRAEITLQELDYLFCEDTRITGVLLKDMPAKPKLKSCNAHNERKRAIELIELLEQGYSVGYISDAGVPGLSDPGGLLVEQIIEAGYRVMPIPGVSALTTLISVSGFNLSHGFYFAGFLPRKVGALRKVLEKDRIIFAYESPYRIRKSLELIAAECPEADICLGRELTKKFEEVLRFKISDIAEITLKEKGEFVIGIRIPKQ